MDYLMTYGMLSGSDRSLKYSKLSEQQLSSTLSGKNALLVGGTKGIGAELALRLSKYKCNVWIAGRSKGKGDELVQKMKEINADGASEFLQVDCSSMKAAAEFARDFRQSHPNVDFIVFTVGILPGPTREETAEGIEKDFAVSYLCRFVMMREWADWLNGMSNRPRVMNIATAGWNTTVDWDDLQWSKSYPGGFASHQPSIVGNDLMVKSYASKYDAFDIFGFNPGIVKTGIISDSGMMSAGFESFLNNVGFTKGAPKYVNRFIHVLASEELSGKSGALFDPFLCPTKYSKFTLVEGNDKKMWEYSEGILQTVLKN